MDALITAAALALASGDALGALKHVGLREDASALTLRGIAMVQLGDLRAGKIRPQESRARVRSERGGGACAVHSSEAELALVARDLSWPAKALDEARATLEAHGDRLNAAHARNIEARRLLLIGSLEEAERVLGEVDPKPLPPLLSAARELVIAGLQSGGCRRSWRALRLVEPSVPRARRHRGADGGSRERLSRAAPARGAFDRAWRGTPPSSR